MTTATTEPLTLPGSLRLIPGREVSIIGMGRCRYHSAALDADGAVAWLNVYDRKGSARSVRPERVREVHRTTKMGPPIGKPPSGRRL